MLPDLPSTNEATSFAEGFERAYQHNLRLPDYESIQVELTIPNWSVSQTKNGYVIGIDGRVQFDNTVTETSNTSPRPSGFFEYSVWYYVTDRFAQRSEPTDGSLTEGDNPDFAGPATVACNSD